MNKLKKGEAIIVAALILICALAALFFVFKTSRHYNAELSEKKISGVSFSSPKEFEPQDALLKKTDEATGKEYAQSFMLDAGTVIRLGDDDVCRLYDVTGKEIFESIFSDDIGNVLNVKSDKGKISFYTDSGGEVSTFLVNGHTLEIMSDKIYIDLIAMKIPEPDPTTEAPIEPTEVKKEEKPTETQATEAPTAEATAAPEQNEQQPAEQVALFGQAEVVLLADDKKEEKPAESETQAVTDPAPEIETRPTIESGYSPASSYSKELMRLINTERTKRGLSELKAKSLMDQSALVRAKEITQDFSHKRADGREADTVLQDYGISYNFYGENIAAGQQSAKDVVSDWMNSEAMRKNILNPDAKYIGSAHIYVKGDKSYLFDYWTVCFFDPMSEKTTEAPENPVPADAA